MDAVDLLILNSIGQRKCAYRRKKNLSRLGKFFRKTEIP